MKRLTVQKKKELCAWVYLIPGAVLMAVFVAAPLAGSLYMSFFKIPSLGAAWEWVGLKNYRLMFLSADWQSAFLRTLLYGAWGIVTGLGFGLLLSFFCAKHRFLKGFRYIFYLPAVVSAITMSRLWSYMLSPADMGLVNTVCAALNIPSQDWLGNEKLVPYVVMATGLYGAGGGMTFVLFTTAINNISDELIEAARIEGASQLQICLRIEIPLIRPVVGAYMMLNVIGAFKNFEGLYALAPNAKSVETIAVLLYKISTTSSDLGYGAGAAMGCVLTAIIMLIMFAYTFWPKKREEGV